MESNRSLLLTTSADWRISLRSALGQIPFPIPVLRCGLGSIQLLGELAMVRTTLPRKVTWGVSLLCPREVMLRMKRLEF
jgi:hypothetical protein